MPSTLETPVVELVGMGQIAAITGDQTAKSVLGSCVGLALCAPARRFATLAHIVLPDSQGKEGPPGKFADTALPHLLELALRAGLQPPALIAKLAGGANMFGRQGPLQIGPKNISAVQSALAQAGIPVVGECLGGTQGRRIELSAATGALHVCVLGQETTTL